MALKLACVPNGTAAIPQSVVVLDAFVDHSKRWTCDALDHSSASRSRQLLPLDDQSNQENYLDFRRYVLFFAAIITTFTCVIGARRGYPFLRSWTGIELYVHAASRAALCTPVLLLLLTFCLILQYYVYQMDTTL